jgi:DNA-binding transcriptional regulator YhcF (GntR family)
MRNVGYIKMHRGWMDNEALKDNDERVLWVTIIERAAWEDTVTFVNGVRVSIPRGSFITSLRKLSNKIDWDAKRVSRFLDRLEKCHMIVTVSDMGMTRVSVCNYDKYNPTRHTVATETAQQAPHKEETKEIKKEIEGWSEFHAAYPCGTKDDGTKRRWPKTGRNSASNAFRETVEAGILPSQLIEAARNYASSGDRAIYNPKRFLKEQHWQDYQKAPKPKDTSIFNKQWDSM